MYVGSIIVAGLFSFLLLGSLIPSSQAELWDFIVELDVEKAAIHSGETVVVNGRIVDHAYEPTWGAKVLISTGAETIKVFTTPDGVFRGEFVNFQQVPGSYTVNVIASWYGMIGLASTEFQVKGNMTSVSLLEDRLSTDEATRYLGSNEGDFEKDPIGQMLFKYYQGLLAELAVEKEKAEKLNKVKALLEQQRNTAKEARENAIKEYGPKAGIYEGYKYDDYVAGLNQEIRDMMINQLNFTKNNFAEAQSIRDEILANGGTYEEARYAYLDKISISKEMLEKFNEEQMEKDSKE